jgi:hypothetical protein
MARRLPCNTNSYSSISNAYITPQTSFTVPSEETEIDGFDIMTFANAPQTPAAKLNEAQQMPPTPMSITKRDLTSGNFKTSFKISASRTDDALNNSSTLETEEPPSSPTRQSKEHGAPGSTQISRRRRRRLRKRSRTLQSPLKESCSEVPDVRPAAIPTSTPEPWPVPFPLADRGIYPYLPPAKQFDQMVRFTSATEEHIEKWNLHDRTYPVPLLRQVLSGQECVHMGLFAQLQHMDKTLEELDKMMQPKSAKERAKRGKVGDKYKRVTPQMLEKIRFMRSITNQHQVCFYESRIPTRPDFKTSSKVPSIKASPAN